MKGFSRWHGRWMLVVAVLGLSLGGNGQWADRQQQQSHQAITSLHGFDPNVGVGPALMGGSGGPQVNGGEPDEDLWPAVGADGQHRVIDACRYDRELQREHDLILCEGHRVLWRFGEQLRQEALDSIRWSAAGGVVGRTVKTALKSARQVARRGQDIARTGLTLPGNVPLGFVRVELKEGSFINRVYDSSGAAGRSQLFGQSFCPGAGLPTDAASAITSRGLNPAFNNAQAGAVFRVNQNITVYQGASLGGTAPELFIPQGLHRHITAVIWDVPIVPKP